MAHDQSPDEAHTTCEPAQDPTRHQGGGGRRLMLAGVIGACALGVGFGLWARPSSVERGDAPPPPRPEIEAEASDRKLEIVLDDTPAPIGQLLDVMPADMAGHHPGPRHLPPPAPDLTAPTGPPAGLIKADAPVPVMTQPPVEALPLALPPKPAPAKAEAKPEKPKAVAKAAQAKPKAAEPKPKTAAKAEKARAEKPKAKPERETRVAKAEPKTAKAKTKAEEPKKLTKLAKAVKTAPEKIKKKAVEAERKTKREIQLAEARLEKAQKAKADKAKQAKVEKARVEKARAEKVRAGKLAAEKKAAARKIELAKAEKARKAAVEKASTPKKKTVVPRGEGPLRVARNDRCVSSDPGEALVCADPRLNQRDRQLQRAFRDAEAAGVPASALQRQQERWRQARTAAARDGSWAVEDVYEARIAELNDLARDARDY